MIYLDYAAHTPTDPDVLDAFYNAAVGYAGNPNSPHPLGTQAKTRLDQCTRTIADIFDCKESQVIYTSGASEANNLAIKGLTAAYSNHGRHIITTYLEHSSVTGPISALAGSGYEVDFVDILPDGQVDIEHLEDLLRDDTILVSICQVDSEIGLIQPVKEIGKLLAEHPNTFFHVDATQAVGKIPVSMEYIDLMTFSPHKFYGLTGCGILLKRDDINLAPLIEGGISTTPYRSGTPALALSVSLEKALQTAVTHREERYQKVQKLYQQLRQALSKYKNLTIHSGIHHSPFILNIGLKGMNTNLLQEKLFEKDICISSKSACCAVNTPSKPVYALTKDRKAALSTLRIGLSHLTTEEEIEIFLKTFETCYNEIKSN